MLENLNLQKVMVLDIETVPQFQSLNEIKPELQALWKHKAHRIYPGNPEDLEKQEVLNDLYFERAGIYAEFGKIICISAGIFKPIENSRFEFRIKSFSGDDESTLLMEFKELMDEHFSKPNQYLCAHNGKEFDFPYICRRMMVNHIKLPLMLNVSGKKPWETEHLLDTMHLWRFGDFKNYTSLDLLAQIMDIPSPKDDIKGSDVAGVYWKEKNLERIVTYCEKDIVTLARLLMRYMYLEPLKDEEIIGV